MTERTLLKFLLSVASWKHGHKMASILLAPLVVQTPHFHQISWGATRWSKEGSDSGNLKRYSASLVAAALVPLAWSNGQAMSGPSWDSVNRLP